MLWHGDDPGRAAQARVRRLKAALVPAAGVIESALEEGVLRVRLHTEMLGAHEVQLLSQALDAARLDRSLRVVVIEGAKNFCCGLTAGFDPLSGGFDPVADLGRLRVPVIAVLRGRAASGGLEIALAADIRVATPDAVLAMPDLALGRLSCWGGIQRLVRCAGAPLATQMVLMRKEVAAEEALRSGLVHELVDVHDLSARVEKLCGRLTSLGPLALEYAKEAVVEGAHLAMPDALRLETDLNILLQASTDRDEGLRAFLARRSPAFTGD